MSSETPSATSSKKRELSSPEYSIEIKKNKVITDTNTDTDTDTDTEASFLEEHKSSTSMASGDLGVDTPAQVTLSEEQLEKNSRIHVHILSATDI